MSKVLLVIKNPVNQSYDFKVEVELQKTVGELKQLISQQYPNNPAPQAQRLIFAGKLLEDQFTLDDLLKQHDTSFPQTFHLVVKTQPTAQPTPATPVQTTPLANNPVPPRAGMPFNGPYGYGFVGQVPPHFQRQQFNFQQFGNFYPPGFVPPHPPQQQPAPAPQPAQQGGNNNMGLLFKLAFLVMILGQGGSTERTVLLAVGAFIAYLYQTGRLRVNVVRRFTPQQANANANAAGNTDANNANADAPVARTGLWNEIVDLVVPFVCSLVPSWSPNPQAVPPPPPMPEMQNDFVR